MTHEFSSMPESNRISHDITLEEHDLGDGHNSKLTRTQKVSPKQGNTKSSIKFGKVSQKSIYEIDQLRERASKVQLPTNSRRRLNQTFSNKASYLCYKGRNERTTIN